MNEQIKNDMRFSNIAFAILAVFLCFSSCDKNEFIPEEEPTNQNTDNETVDSDTVSTTPSDTVNVDPEPDPDPKPDSSDVQQPSAMYPSELMSNYKQWKITLPDGDEIKNLYQVKNEYFYVSSDEDAIVFFAPIRSNNGTTPNSSYIRSEVRERTETGNSDIYWTTADRHIVYVKQAITHLPLVKNHLVATQIHGNKDEGIDDSMVLDISLRNRPPISVYLCQ